VLIRNIWALTLQMLRKERLGGMAVIAGGERALVLVPESLYLGGYPGSCGHVQWMLHHAQGCCIPCA